jgi:hypothetical protein
MALQRLHPDFVDPLTLFHSHKVEYPLVGGYAVGYYGYPRFTGDLELWIDIHPGNAERVAAALIAFGMSPDSVTPELFRESSNIIRIGVPPVRAEVLTGISGVQFAECYERRVEQRIENVPIAIIALEDLRRNKRAAGPHKDLDDLEHLPD